ncbi:streptococcal hemagglutinin-like isoform X2 [Littorina saxatilis]|uniref:streptococcal hemagglutinin-like isoform X2 n=1 Tax=Littorina saxatilis TaxID=31220 RepID=UPI0038B42714
MFTSRNATAERTTAAMAASTTTAASESSSPTISDTDLETVNTEELVMFNSTQTFYTNKEDICVFYTAGNDVDIAIKDWVGLFRSGWEATRDFSTYRCVQFTPYNVFAPRTRKTIFPQLDIQGLFGDFQFLYVTAEEQVIGVSERFKISDLEPKSDSPVLISETILQSLSLISLESMLSSSSDSSQSVDESTFEKVKSASEEALSKPVFDVPVLSSVVSSNDNWSLSDFVIGTNSGALCEKLRFPETLDAKSIVDEYEPLKQFYLSLRPRKQALIEEVKEDQSDSAPPSSSKDSKTSALVLYNRPISFPSSSFPSPSTRVLSFSRERFQRSCLEMYRQNLLQSKPEECKPTWVLPITSILEMNDGCLSKNPKHMPPESTQEKDKAQQLAVFSFEREEPVENDENCISNAASKKQKVCTSSGSHKQAEPKQAFNGKKKRSVKTSRTKTNRDKQDAMLKEAMTLIATPTSVPPTSPKTQSIPVATTSASTSKAKSPNRLQSRKRTIPTTPGVSKRRRLNGRWSMPALDQCRADDEGYGTTDDEGEQNTEGRSSVERIELLNLALTEELANNADLRLQIQSQQHEAEKCNASSNTAPRSKGDTTIQCATVDTAGKAVNTEKKKKCNAASNTTKVSKKDTQSQCTGTKTTGKATNTEKKEKRHAASNTASVTKKDTPSQCTKAKTAGAATNTAPVPPTKDAEINTPVVHSTDSSVQSHNNKPDILPAVQPETIQVDVILRSLASTGPLNSDISLDKWRVVSSKRMLRLRRLIAKKKEEFHMIRENADNYEKRSHTLEAQLTSVRVTLSTETAKRLTAEKELQELRSKFWELLAARSSQPWKSTSNCSQGVLVNPFEQAPAVPALRPVTFLEPVSFKSPEFTPTESTSSIQALIPVEFSFKESSDNRQLKALPEQKEHTLAIPRREANEPTSPNKAQIKILLKEKALAKKSEKTFSDLIKSSDNTPLVSTAQFKTVPVSVDRVKKATAGAISFKKFLMPAMTALAETFSSSKPKCKDVNVDENLTGSSSTKSVDGKKSSGAVANVTVSVSAGTPSSKTVHKNDSKCKKTKSSRSKERGRKESCKHPCQETSPDSSSETTIRRQSSPASKSKAHDKLDAFRSLPELSEGSKPVQESMNETDEEKKETSASKRILGAEARVWHPLTIPLGLGAEGGVAEGRGTAPISMEPIKFCFTHEPQSAGKGRPFSYADIAAGAGCMLPDCARVLTWCPLFSSWRLEFPFLFPPPRPLPPPRDI